MIARNIQINGFADPQSCIGHYFVNGITSPVSAYFETEIIDARY
jgi:hypothetical protein